MMKQILAGVTSASMVFTVFAPVALAAADTEVTVDHNGAGSVNTVVVDNAAPPGGSLGLEQKNIVMSESIVLADASTGDNTIKGNTGAGNSTNNTGDASSTATNSTSAGSNTATVTGCGCQTPTTDVVIKDNGAGSINTVVVTNKAKKPKEIEQKNVTLSGALVGATSSTGGNKIKNNTGAGNRRNITGTATSTATNSTTGGSNVLTVN